MKPSRIHIPFIIALMASPLLCQPAAGQGNRIIYKTYYNSRFEYSISYPVGILYPQEVAANGDGRKFLSKDKRTVMLVYGQENVQGRTLSQLYSDESREDPDLGKVVAYKASRGNWFVVSGYQGDMVFYQKTMYRNDEFLTFRIEYPEAQKKVFDPITTTIAKSFK